MTDFTSSTTCVPAKTATRGLMSYVALYRQRRALAAMTDSRLVDLGLSRHEADAEAKRPVWDAPNHWK